MICFSFFLFVGLAPKRSSLKPAESEKALKIALPGH
jgi:hypothetical protein